MKPKLSAKSILEIANRLDKDERCFIHPETGAVEFVFNFDNGDFDIEDYFDGIPEEKQEEERARIDDMIENWIELDPMETREEFGVMESYMESMHDQKMKDALWKALKGNRPFANFKNQLERDAKVRARWFEFETQAKVAYIEGQLERENIDFESSAKPSGIDDETAPEPIAIGFEAPVQLDQNMIQVQRLGKDHAEFLQEINALFQEVFEKPTSPSASLPYLTRILWSEKIIAYGLLYNHELIGALTAYVLPGIYSEAPTLFLYDIAIRKPFQRRGLGSQMLKTLRNWAKKNGISYVFVAADEEDTHALDFYTRAGGTPSKVVHFDFNP